MADNAANVHDGNGQGNEEDGPPRSLNNDTQTYIRFKNRCDRTAVLYWFNFKGDFVRYAVLRKEEYIDMNTYVTHPWCAREFKSNVHLAIDSKPVYYPIEVKIGTYKLVNIDIPVYTLKDRCKQILWEVFPGMDLEQLEIPKVLTNELHNKGKVTYTDYKHLQVPGDLQHQ